MKFLPSTRKFKTIATTSAIVAGLLVAAAFASATGVDPEFKQAQLRDRATNAQLFCNSIHTEQEPTIFVEQDNSCLVLLAANKKTLRVIPPESVLK